MSDCMRIHELEKKLRDTDYKIIQMIEGCDVPDIAEVKQQREEWRNEIRRLRTLSTPEN